MRFLVLMLNVDGDVTHANSDLGHDGDLDGLGIDLPPNPTNIFQEEHTTLTEDDQNLLGVLLNNAPQVTADNTPTVEDSSGQVHPTSLNSTTSPAQPSPPMPMTSNTSAHYVSLSQFPEPVQNKWLKKDEDGNFKKGCCILTKAAYIPDAPPAGYKAPPNDNEKQVIKEYRGTDSEWAQKGSYFESESNPRMTRGFYGSAAGVEHLLTIYCKAAACKCVTKVARTEGHILFYEEVDKHGVPFEHTGHDLSREDEKEYRPPNKNGKKASAAVPSKSKYGPMTLTTAQCTFIKKFGMGMVKTNSWYDLAKEMNISAQCELSAEQAGDLHQFSRTIAAHVKRKKQSGDEFFVNDWGRQTMSGEQCEEVLNALMTPASERDEKPALQGVPLVRSTEFDNVWKKIEVMEHNYDGTGSKFDHILLQYNDASERASLASRMYPDRKVQLEMDFLMGVCGDDEWQVGHIGFSDQNHRYWILGMVISRSENNEAAGKLLRHALTLLKNAGGDGNRVLVDGGKALNKAIGNENDIRKLLEELTLEKRRCHAHCIRMPFSRGGGYRGGKGSVPKKLLEDGVSRDIVGKIVGMIIMMTYIPPDDKESFGHAVDLLIEEYGQHLSDHMRETYLTKNPCDLGGICAGRAGEVGSTQGCEKRGGNLKRNHKNILGSYELRSTKNPIY